MGQCRELPGDDCRRIVDIGKIQAHLDEVARSTVEETLNALPDAGGISMWDNADSMWEKYGKSDPYYAVLSRDQFHSNNLPQSKDIFFKTGEEHVNRVLQEIEQRFGTTGRRSVLDFGCGVGRLLLPLSPLFDRVDGMDVSPSMLEEASANLGRCGIKNVELLRSDDTLASILNREYDLVHSYLVFQHIPRKRGYNVLDKLLSHVRPNGCFYIQVIERTASPLRQVAKYVKHHLPFAYMGVNLLDRRHPLSPTMQMNSYDFGTLVRIFKRHGFATVAFQTQIHPCPGGSFSSVSFFSRKPV